MAVYVKEQDANGNYTGHYTFVYDYFISDPRVVYITLINFFDCQGFSNHFSFPQQKID